MRQCKHWDIVRTVTFGPLAITYEAHGHYDPGVVDQLPENCYPPDSEDSGPMIVAAKWADKPVTPEQLEAIEGDETISDILDRDYAQAQKGRGS